MPEVAPDTPAAKTVFISYANEDTAAAQAACRELEGAGVSCWFAPRDARGAKYGGSITRAIGDCRLLLLVLSEHSNGSADVAQEVAQAFGEKKEIGIWRVADVKPSADLAHFTAGVRWQDGFPRPNSQKQLQGLRRYVGSLLGGGGGPGPSTRRRWPYVVSAAALALALGALLWVLLPGRGATAEPGVRITRVEQVPNQLVFKVSGELSTKFESEGRTVHVLVRDNDFNSGAWWVQKRAVLEGGGKWSVMTNQVDPADRVEMKAVVTAVPYADSSRVSENFSKVETQVQAEDGQQKYHAQPFEKLAVSETYAVGVTRPGPAAPPATPPGGARVGRGPLCPGGNGLFVLYYGSDEKDFKRIHDAQPNFVVVGDGLHDNPEVPALFHKSDAAHGPVRVLAYVLMEYGNRPAAEVDAESAAAMKAGYDGVFFDTTDDALADWNRARARVVKDAGEKLVVMNPGKSRVAADIFEYADIVSVENKYAESPAADPGPPKGVPAWRWLAVQGDPAGHKELAAAGSAAEALKRLGEFRSKGGFWYYSPAVDKADPLKATHVLLPDWLEEFAEAVKKEGGPRCKP